jgi:hypothetical protein
VHYNIDALAAMATVVFRVVFLLGSLQRRKKGPRGEWRWHEGGRGEGLGFDGSAGDPRWGLKGGERSMLSAWCVGDVSREGGHDSSVREEDDNKKNERVHSA